MKRQNDDNRDEGNVRGNLERERGGGGYRGGPNKRPRNDSYADALAAGKYELRLLIPTRAAGAIIGKAGSNIKEIREKYDANLSVPDMNTPERVLTINCRQEVIVDCFQDILVKLAESQDRRKRDELEIRMLIHQSHAGAIIGRGGEKIKELREQTDSNLKVFQELCPYSNERVLLITALQDKVPNVIRVVVDFLRDVPIKGIQKPYDAGNYNPQFAYNYGGYEDTNRFGGGGRGGGRDGGYGGDRRGPLRDGRGPPRDSRGPPRDAYQRGPSRNGNDRRGPPHDSRGPPRDDGRYGNYGGGYGGGGYEQPGSSYQRHGGYAGGSNYGGDYGSGPTNYGGGGNFGDGVASYSNPGNYSGPLNPQTNVTNPLSGYSAHVSTQVPISDSCASILKENYGQRLTSIAQSSGAALKLEDRNPNNPYRIITISGDHPQVNKAQFLLQATIHTTDNMGEQFPTY